MIEKIKEFEKHLRTEERADNTINKYLRDIKEFYKWFLRDNPKKSCIGGHHQTEVTKEILLDYKECLKNSKLKVSSINSKISSLNAFFAYTENELLKIKVLKCQKSLFGSKEKELTRHEFNKLYEASKYNIRLKYIIETIVKTGIRVSEIQYITRESLDAGKTIVDNKGKIRTILIPRKLCKLLKDYCKGSCGVEHLQSPIESGPIFLTRTGKPISRKQIWQMMKDLATKAGVPKEKVFPHNLRHLFAREFYKQTHDIVKLASILGHSSIETTRIYTKETEDECRHSLEIIEILKE